MISSSDFSADERRLCTGSWDKTVNVWDLNAGSYRYDKNVLSFSFLCGEICEIYGFVV